MSAPSSSDAIRHCFCGFDLISALPQTADEGALDARRNAQSMLNLILASRLLQLSAGMRGVGRAIRAVPTNYRKLRKRQQAGEEFSEFREYGSGSNGAAARGHRSVRFPPSRPSEATAAIIDKRETSGAGDDALARSEARRLFNQWFELRPSQGPGDPNRH